VNCIQHDNGKKIYITYAFKAMDQRHYYAYHTELQKLKHGTGTKATTQQNELYKIR